MFNHEKVFLTDGIAGETFQASSSDVAQSIADLKGASVQKDGQDPVGALITFETNDMRVAQGGATPAAGGLGHLVSDGDSMRLSSNQQVDTWRVISNAAGTHGTVTVTLFYPE